MYVPLLLNFGAVKCANKDPDHDGLEEFYIDEALLLSNNVGDIVLYPPYGKFRIFPRTPVMTSFLAVRHVPHHTFASTQEFAGREPAPKP